MKLNKPEAISAEHLKTILEQALRLGSEESVNDDTVLQEYGATYATMCEVILSAEGDLGWALDDSHDIWTDAERMTFPQFHQTLNRAAGAV